MSTDEVGQMKFRIPEDNALLSNSPESSPRIPINLSKKLFRMIKDDDGEYLPWLLKISQDLKQFDNSTILKAAIYSLSCCSGKIKSALFGEVLSRFRPENVDPTFMRDLSEGFSLLTTKIGGS